MSRQSRLLLLRTRSRKGAPPSAKDKAADEWCICVFTRVSWVFACVCVYILNCRDQIVRRFVSASARRAWLYVSEYVRPCSCVSVYEHVEY